MKNGDVKFKFILFSIFFIAFFGMAKISEGAVVFEDNFDDHPDWSSPTQENATGSDHSYTDGTPETACTLCPQGTSKWTGMFISRSAWDDYVGNPTIQINSTNRRGGAGKAITMWEEPIDSPTCDGGTGWCSDGSITKVLPESYNDIFIRFYIKFDPSWVWNTDPLHGGGNCASEKFVRVSQYHNPPGVMYQWFTGPQGSNHPGFVLQFGYPQACEGGDRTYIGFSPRYSATYYPSAATPQYVSEYGDIEYRYFPGGTGYLGYKTWSESLGDGNWHHVELQLKGNTAGGYYAGSPNGEMRMWVDGQMIGERTDLAWADAADPDNTWTPSPFAGWNYVTLGGNQYNKVYDVSQHIEQWYAIDDVVLSTTYVGPDYVIGGADTTPPSAPTGLSVS
jgi:hypothetical protein